jgi:hypothetical protein
VPPKAPKPPVPSRIAVAVTELSEAVVPVTVTRSPVFRSDRDPRLVVVTLVAAVVVMVAVVPF